MKNTIVFLILVFLSMGLVKEVRALVPVRTDLQIKVSIIPTATPTPIIYKKIDPGEINFQVIASATPTPKEVVVTKVVSPTPEEGTVTISPKVSSAITKEEVSEAPTATEAKQETNLSKWFTWITIGLLILIVVIQIWPKKGKTSDK